MARETTITCDVCGRILVPCSFQRVHLGKTYDLCEGCYERLQVTDMKHEEEIGEILTERF